MTQAIWKETLLAESDHCEVVENNFYFPPDSVKREFFQNSDKTTVCGWKGIAHYYHIEVKGEKNLDAAWYYPEPKEKALKLKDYIAFWKGVEVD